MSLNDLEQVNGQNTHAITGNPNVLGRGNNRLMLELITSDVVNACSVYAFKRKTAKLKTPAVCYINLLVLLHFLPNVLRCSICVLWFPISAGLPALKLSKFIIMSSYTLVNVG